jgi:PTS system nitrogen regulatory IIA component
MTLSNILPPDLVLPRIVCGSKDELISILVDHVYSTGREPPLPAKDILNAIHIREEIGGTLLPSGLSVPHARLKDYDGFIISVGLPASPLVHEGLQVRMMALMISSQTGGPHYLTSLAALTKISRDAEYFARLCRAETPEEFMEMLRECDPELA